MPVARTALTDAYTRLSEVLPGLGVTELAAADEVPSGGGWVTAASLAAGGTELAAFLAWDEAQVLRDYGQRARPDVIASFGLHRYAWPACLLITVPWFLHRRVPRHPAAHVSYDRTAAGLPLGRMAVRAASFACLPGDPAAALPGARVVADEEALRAEVRAAVAEHLEPVLAGFGPGCGGADVPCGGWRPTRSSRACGTSPTCSASRSGRGTSWSCCCRAPPGRTSGRRPSVN